MRLLTFLLAIVVVALVVAVSLHVQTGRAGSGVKLNLKVAPPTVLVGEAFVADLDALSVPSPGLGSWTVDVVLDPDFVTAESCAPQQSTSCGIFDTNVRFNGFTFDGLTGDIDLGSITFSADAPGNSPLEIVVFGMTDTAAGDLTVGMTINETSITITSDAATSTPTDEPLPGLDDTATPTPTGPTPSPTITATPTITPTPVLATIIVNTRSGGTLEPFGGWVVNVFPGDGCQGDSIAFGTTGVVGTYSSPPLPLGPYSVSLKLREGFTSASPLCQDLLLQTGPDAFNAVTFVIAPQASGDVNEDGSANSVDAALILQFDAALLDELPNADRADVNLDEIINPIDATLILQFDAGFLDSLPVGGG